MKAHSLSNVNGTIYRVFCISKETRFASEIPQSPHKHESAGINLEEN